MKTRVKFRFVHLNGPSGKLVISLKEGEIFAFTDSTLGHPSKGASQVHLLLTVKNMATYLRGGSGIEGVTVNGTSGEEFILHTGDLVVVSGKTIEFLDLPERDGEEPDTRYLNESGADESDEATRELHTYYAGPIGTATLKETTTETPQTAPTAPRKNPHARGIAIPALIIGIISQFIAFSRYAEAPAIFVSVAPPVERAARELPTPGATPTESIHALIGTTFVREPRRDVLAESKSLAEQYNQDKVRFFLAIRYGEVLTVKEMVDAFRVDPLAVSESGANPLMQAAYYGQLDIAKYLIDLGMDINATDPQGATALMYAVRGNRPQTAAYLLSKGADSSIAMDNKVHALDIAKKNGLRKIIPLLDGTKERRPAAEKYDSVVK